MAARVDGGDASDGGWICDSQTNCNGHFASDATTESGVACCGSGPTWRLACYVCQAEGAPRAKVPKVKKARARRAKMKKKGPKPTDAADAVAREVSFDVGAVCADYTSCTEWHGSESRCCYGTHFCTECTEDSTYTGTAFGANAPQCWDEEGLAFFLALGVDEVTASRSFSTTCNTMLYGVYDTTGCCANPTACDTCLSDPEARVQASVDGKSKKTSKVAAALKSGVVAGAQRFETLSYYTT